MARNRRRDDHERLREELAEGLGHPVTHAQWAWLVHEDECVEEALSFPAAERRRVLLEGWRRLQQAEADDRARAKPDKAGDEPERDLWLTQDESARASAASVALAAAATGVPGVQLYRAAFLDGRQLSEAEAREVLARADPANAPGLHELAGALALLYGWGAEEAALFVLTGAVPHVVPLTAVIERFDAVDEWEPERLRTRATITLRVEPWVGAETVALAYRALQRDAMGKDRKPVGRRELALVRFVLERLMAGGEPVGSWAQLARAWNEHHREDGWAYANPHNLKPAYERARRRLLQEDYRILGFDAREPRRGDVVRRRAMAYRAFLDDDILGAHIWASPAGDDGNPDGNPDGNR